MCEWLKQAVLKRTHTPSENAGSITYSRTTFAKSDNYAAVGVKCAAPYAALYAAEPGFTPAPFLVLPRTVLQTPEEQLAQFAERAQLAIWLIGSAPSIEAVALAENIYERAFEGARSLGHRLAVRPTVEGWRFVPTPLLRMKRRTG